MGTWVGVAWIAFRRGRTSFTTYLIALLLLCCPLVFQVCHVPGCHELGETRQRLISLFQAVVCQLLLVLGKLRLEPWIP